MRVIDDPAFADIFAPDALVEAPVAAVVGETVVAGTVDRLLVTDGHVRVIDFKTGSRVRSEEHTSELQSLMRISYAVFCLKKKNTTTQTKTTSGRQAHEKIQRIQQHNPNI